MTVFTKTNWLVRKAIIVLCGNSRSFNEDGNENKEKEARLT